jgi:hypothetical protein
MAWFHVPRSALLEKLAQLEQDGYTDIEFTADVPQAYWVKATAPGPDRLTVNRDQLETRVASLVQRGGAA